MNLSMSSCDDFEANREDTWRNEMASAVRKRYKSSSLSRSDEHRKKYALVEWAPDEKG